MKINLKIVTKVSSFFSRQLNWFVIGLFVHTISLSSICQVDLIKDINTTTIPGFPSNPQKFIALGNQVIFVAETETLGAELWVTDGTTSGTQLLMDIIVTQVGNNMGYSKFVEYDSSIYFIASQAVEDGAYLWKTDGTSSGTIPLFPVSGSNENLIIYDGFLYYSSVQPGYYGDSQLWRTDGTLAGTSLVKSLPPTSAQANNFDVSNFIVFDGFLYFNGGYSGNGSSSYYQLWRSDGTELGTQKITGVFGTNLTEVGGTLFFTSVYDGLGSELWTTDGTSAGTQIVLDIVPGSQSSYVSNLISFNNELYFSANDGTNGAELWKSDGTALGTYMVANINPIAGQSSSPSNFTVHNGLLIFNANNGTVGKELWVSNGTSAGTVLLKDIYTGATDGDPINFCVSNNQLFFSAKNAAQARELWLTNGTTSGTVLVSDIYPSYGNSNPTNLFDFNGTLLFAAANTGNNIELWRSNGTSAGTSLVKNINPDANPSDIRRSCQVNDKIYFIANNGVTENGLWESDGTEAGTNFVLNLGTNQYGVNSPWREIAKLNDDYLIYNGGPSINPELYIVNVNTGVSQMLLDINPYTGGSNPYGFTKSGNYTYFIAYINTTGQELWRTDGTVAGTIMVKEIVNGTTGADINNMIDLNGVLYFTAYSSGAFNIWKSDGTTAGTEIVTSAGTSDVGPYFVHNNELYFGHFVYSNIGSSTYKIKKTDGTSTGTVTLHTFTSNETAGNGQISNMVSLNGILYFTTNNQSGLYSLWRSDGTVSGTYGIAIPGDEFFDTRIEELVVMQGKLYFSYKHPTFGLELWTSDGTSAGTQIVVDIYPGQIPSNPSNLKVVNNVLYFTATDGINGFEFWKSKGDSTNTMMFAQLDPNEESSTPLIIGNLNNQILFEAYSTTTNRELYGYFSPIDTFVVACESYFWPQTGDTYTSSGIYTDSLIGQNGTDSILILNLTINYPSNSTDNQTVCDSLVWIDGTTYYDNNNSASYVLSNSQGCDSTVTLNLTILNSSSYTDVQYACNSFTWLDGNTYTSSNNSATYIVENAQGCDSIITLNLTIGTNSTDTQSACNSYTWIDGNTYTSNNNTATFVLPNSVGCDSTISLDLTILNSSISTDVQIACNSYTWIDGNTYTSDNNTATFVLPNSVGCDSTITLDLTILNSSSSTDVQTACDSYTWIDGNTYTSDNNTATFILISSEGCDSIVTLDLEIQASQPLTVNTFVLPDDGVNCLGQLAVTNSGNADFMIDLDAGSTVAQSSGYISFNNLCAGIHDIVVTDNCGTSITDNFVIPIDTNYVFINPFVDSLAMDSLGITLQNCDIYYNSIDTAYIESLFMTGNVVNIVWNIIDANGANSVTTTYTLNNGSGVYWVQLSVFCPTKSVIGYFTVTQAIYFDGQNIFTVGLHDEVLTNILLFPNPAKDLVKLVLPSPSEEIIKVYDVAGKEVFELVSDFSTINFDISRLNQGVYTIRVIINGSIVVKRFIVQH